MPEKSQPPRGATIHEIARACGVSAATVSRVFNGKRSVRPVVCDRVFDAARRLSYRPRVTTRRECVAILVEGYRQISLGGYTGMLITSLTRPLLQEGLQLEIIPVADMQLLHQHLLRAVVACLYRPESVARLAALDDVPLITVNEVCPGVPAVCSNERQGMRLAVDYLADRGHRRIALLRGANVTWCRRERQEGFRAALAARGINHDGVLVQQAPEKEYLLEPLVKLMKQNPTALIVETEDWGIAASYYLHLLGKQVPEEVSLVAFEYTGVSCYCTPPHTTLCQDLDRISALTLEWLNSVKQKKEPARAKPFLADYVLIERESVRRLS